VYKDLFNNGFVQNYTRWIHHGERDRIREEVVRPLLEEYDADAGMADFHEGRFVEGMEVEEDPEETAKAFYTMMEASQKPLHKKTMVSQLYGISRLIVLKSQLGISRDGFDLVLTVLGKLLPEIMSPPCNTILLLLPCNYVSLFTTTSHLFMLTILIFVIAGTRQNVGRRRKEEAATTELPLALRRSRR
jgi:hypothetical protein